MSEVFRMTAKNYKTLKKKEQDRNIFLGSFTWDAPLQRFITEKECRN